MVYDTGKFLDLEVGAPVANGVDKGHGLKFSCAPCLFPFAEFATEVGDGSPVRPVVLEKDSARSKSVLSRVDMDSERLGDIDGHEAGADVSARLASRKATPWISSFQASATSTSFQRQASSGAMMSLYRGTM